MSDKRKHIELAVGPSNNTAKFKRTRFTSTACNECKRRKVKCNGNDPCQRCLLLSLQCVHAPSCCTNSIQSSPEFKNLCQEVADMQRKMAELSDAVLMMAESLKTQKNASTLVPNGDISQTSAWTPRPNTLTSTGNQHAGGQVYGPSSSDYGLAIANSSLQRVGIVNEPSREFSPRGRVPISPPSAKALVEGEPNDPLFLITYSEVVRLCRLFEDDVGSLYPVVPIDEILQYAAGLYESIVATSSTGSIDLRLSGPGLLHNIDATILKMLLATSLTVEANGHSEQGWLIFNSAKPFADSLVANAIDMKSIMLMTLTATFYYHHGDEVQAWRSIGIAARMCLEIGLHRRKLLWRMFADDKDRVQAIRLFWIVYALDRRWSFGTGMPFAIREKDIDPALPGPDDENAYLKHITIFNQLATKVWSCNRAYHEDQRPQKDEIDLLNYQVQEWYNGLPEEQQFDHRDLQQESRIKSRAVRRIRLIMYLRKNQLRLSTYRPVLHSAASINENLDLAKDAVNIAREMVNTLTELNQISDIYRNQQVTFNHYLVHALAVLFLSVAHAPTLFYHSAKREYYSALRLIKENGTKSYVSKCLWRSIRGLKDIGDKIALLTSPTGQQQQISTNEITPQLPPQQLTLPMNIELDDHDFDYQLFDNQYLEIFGHHVDDEQESGYALQMSNGLSSLFELAGNYGNRNGNGNVNEEPVSFPAESLEHDPIVPNTFVDMENIDITNHLTSGAEHNISSNDLETEFSLSMMSNSTEFARLVNGLL